MKTSVNNGHPNVNTNTLSTDTSVSKGAIPRTLRSASQSFDTASVVGSDSTSASAEVLQRTSLSSSVRSAANSNVRSAYFSTSSHPNTNAKSALSLKRFSSATKVVDAAFRKKNKLRLLVS